MNLIKSGLLGVVAASVFVAACGSSSSDDSASKAGSGNTGGSSSSTAGSSSSTAGSSSSTAGSSSSSGGKSSGTGGATGTAGTGAGATGGASCTTSMDPTGMMSDQCPDLTTCAQSMCKSAFDACTTPCADYQKCIDACNCDATCEGNCTQSDACSTCSTTAVNCITSKCSTQFNACVSGALGDAGGGKTCKDLADCCKTLPMDQQSDCMMSAMGGIDAICDLAYSFICTSN